MRFFRYMKIKGNNCKIIIRQHFSFILLCLLMISFLLLQSASFILFAESNQTDSTSDDNQTNQIEDIKDDDLNINNISNNINLSDSNKNSSKTNNSQKENIHSDNSNLTTGNSYTNFESNFDSCLSLDKSHQIYFYSLNSTQSDNYPISFYLTLTLCALDKYKIDQTIKSPKFINNINDQALTLLPETNYPLEYLLYAVLLKQSDSAVITLAEALSSNENKLVELLNKKAELLKLDNTQFNYISLKNHNNRINLSLDYKIDEHTQLAPFAATSSTSDIAKLYKTLLNNSFLNKIISQAEYSYYSQNILNVFTNPFSIIWSLYPNEIQNALSYEDANISTYICNLKFSNFDCLIVLNKYLNTNDNSQVVKNTDYYQNSFATSISEQKKEALNEISELRQAIRNNWVISKLFSSQEEYKESIEVEPFKVKLKFPNDIYYIHPIQSTFISSEEFSLIKKRIKLPIKSGDKLAQLKLTLENKKVINVDLLAKDNYRTSNDFLDEFLPIYNKYKGICILILLLLILFIFLIIYKVVKLIFKPFLQKSK